MHPTNPKDGEATVRFRLLIGGLMCLAVVVAGACSSDDSRPETGIEAQDPTLVAEGEVLYRANCAECHGSDLRGTDTGPSHLSIVYEPNHHGDGAFALAVYNGVRQHHWSFGDMAPVEGLGDDDIVRITAFVRENQRLSGFEPYPP